MKRLLALSFLLAVVYAAQAQTRLKAAFDYSLFRTNEEVPYLEAYLKVFAGSFYYKPTGKGTYSSKIEITLAASSQPGQWDWADKYILETGELSPKDTGNAAYLDAKRFFVKEGKFRIDLIISDLNSPTPSFVEYADSITISLDKTKPVIAKPVLVDRHMTSQMENTFTKGSIDIIPNMTGYYDGEDSVMYFYTEIYDTPKFLGEGERFVLRYYLKNSETNAVIASTEGIKVATVQKEYAGLFPISLKNVGPDYYTLMVEVRNKNNELITSTERILERGGKINYVVSDLSNVGTDFMALVENVDTLKEYILCLNPIIPRIEQDFALRVLKNGDKEMMKKFIVSFWMRRNSIDPLREWLKYKAKVAFVEKEFGARYLRGYNTERGRVFLQYGPPNVRSERPNEPFAYPYEIWQYYEMYNPISGMRQTNRKFVFWNRNDATNNYELLHSDALGETRNERWEMVLFGRGKGTTDPDQTSPGQQNGSMGRDIFNNPR